MTEKILTQVGTADWVLNVVLYSLAILVIGWLGLKLSRRASAPLYSGICLTLMLCVMLLPACFLFFPSHPRPLIQASMPKAERAYLDKGVNESSDILDSLASKTHVNLTTQKKTSSAIKGSQKPGWQIWLSESTLIRVANTFGIIWLLGFVLMLNRLGWGLMRLVRFKKRLIRIKEEEYEAAFPSIQSTFPQRMMPLLFVSDEVDSPFTTGILRPIIVFPRPLFTQINAAELKSILLHEMAHVLHKDHRVGILQRIIQALYWWNPFIYPVSAGLSRAREYISDNYAIRESNAFTYARSLMTLAEKTCLSKGMPVSMGIAAPHVSLEERIKTIMSDKRTMQMHLQRPAVVILMLIAFLSMLFALKYSWTLAVEKNEFVTTTLSALKNPTSINVDGDEIFITEESCISVYSLKNFRLKKRFGQNGSGPGEFEIRPQLTIFPDYLLVNSMGKLGYYSRDAVLQKEQALPFRYLYMYYPMLPVGERYLGFKLKRSGSDERIIHVGSLYNQDFLLLKEFYTGGPPQLLPPPKPESDRPKIDLDVVYDCFDVAVTEDRIFVADTRKGFYIAVFDFKGDLLYEIKKDYEKLRIPEEFKESFLQKQRESGHWDWLQERYNYIFREYYSAFFSFKLTEGRIYVTTFASKDNNYELITMDLKGNIIHKAFVFPLHPLKRISSGSLYAYSNEYDIHDHKIYYLMRNEPDKTIALHVKSIE